jgi:hypothetical protein
MCPDLRCTVEPWGGCVGSTLDSSESLLETVHAIWHSCSEVCGFHRGEHDMYGTVETVASCL